MPLPRKIVLFFLAWSAPQERSLATAATNAPKDTSSLMGPMCCRICQNRFNNELNFLEIDEEAKTVARRGFESWSRSSSFLEASSEPDRKAPCCSVCVADFVATDADLDVEIIPREGPFSMIPNEPQAPPPRQRQSALAAVFIDARDSNENMPSSGAGSSTAAAATTTTKSRKKSTSSGGALSPLSFVELQASAGAATSTAEAARKGSGNLGGGCCNVCSAQSKGSSPMTSKVVGLGGGSKRTEGGCCTACASRFMGASEFGAPPFGEPGNREQNIGAVFPSVIDNMDDFSGRLYNPTHKHQATIPGFTKRQLKLSHTV